MAWVSSKSSISIRSSGPVTTNLNQALGRSAKWRKASALILREASMPELAEYAVIGAADERWGETTVACVVLREGAALDAATLIKRFEGQLARFKHPRRVEFMNVLPRNAMGKVLKFKLREMLNSE